MITKKNTAPIENNTAFGGIIYIWDYCTDYAKFKNIAGRIESDMKFDEQCRKNILSRKHEQNTKTKEI